MIVVIIEALKLNSHAVYQPLLLDAKSSTTENVLALPGLWRLLATGDQSSVDIAYERQIPQTLHRGGFGRQRC